MEGGLNSCEGMLSSGISGVYHDMVFCGWLAYQRRLLSAPDLCVALGLLPAVSAFPVVPAPQG